MNRKSFVLEPRADLWLVRSIFFFLFLSDNSIAESPPCRVEKLEIFPEITVSRFS